MGKEAKLSLCTNDEPPISWKIPKKQSQFDGCQMETGVGKMGEGGRRHKLRLKR